MVDADKLIAWCQDLNLDRDRAPDWYQGVEGMIATINELAVEVPDVPDVQAQNARLRNAINSSLEWLESQTRRHHYCEDGYYSCPRSPLDYQDVEGKECDCGADKFNAELAAIIAMLQQAAEAQECVK